MFKIDLNKDLVIGTLSIGLGVSHFFINNEPENMHGILNKYEVNNFDKYLMFSYNKQLDIISDSAPYGFILLPLISILPNIKHINTFLTYGIMYGESLLFTYGTVFLLKKSIIRYRPYMYADDIPDGKEKDYYNSFPSGAASFSFLGAAFLSTTFAYEFPESKWKLPIILGSHMLAAGIGAMRILSGTHFITDIFTGAAIGSLYGWLIPSLHKGNYNRNYSIIPTGTGLIFSIYF
jgi:membrane-associated phospholipid phosphatase